VPNRRNEQQNSILPEAIKAAATIAVAVIGSVVVARGTTIALAKRAAREEATAIYQKKVLDAFPKGIILPWNLQSGAVPEGWAICDGENNGTPDLENRFLLGVRAMDEVGKLGGIEVKESDKNGKQTTFTLPELNLARDDYKTPTGLVTSPVGNDQRAIITKKLSTQYLVNSYIPEVDKVPINLPPYYQVIFIMKMTDMKETSSAPD
jgi:hypothetical protein